MGLTEYLDGMQAATTAAELEAAIQVEYKHLYHGRTWSRIGKVRIQAGERIVAAHPNGRFVPRFGAGRRLTVCGETYKVGVGQNSTGVRYVWHYAQQWAESVLRANGFTMRAAYAIWDNAFGYPHRALAVVADALDGKLPDPRFNRLTYIRNTIGGPVRVNRRTEAKNRAHRPCKCGGWRWDWGCGWNGYALFIHWYCDRCTRIYEEYVTDERITEIRSAA